MATESLSLLPDGWLELPNGDLFWLKARCAIGRDASNDLVLAAPGISGQHALIALGPNGTLLTDLHSRNGTYLNGELLTKPARLRDGDEIQLGLLKLRHRCNRQVTLSGEEPEPRQTIHLDQVRSRECWLLVTDIAGYVTLTETLGSAAAQARLQKWIEQVRPFIESSAGKINGYVGDAIFAYWPCDATKPAHVLAALERIQAYRGQSELSFRVVVHQGEVLFSKSDAGEELGGREVNFVFRAEKIAKQFRRETLLSEAAVQGLQIANRSAFVGAAEIPGLKGSFAFYDLTNR